jgi:hypothetical protein
VAAESLQCTLRVLRLDVPDSGVQEYINDSGPQGPLMCIGFVADPEYDHFVALVPKSFLQQ